MKLPTTTNKSAALPAWGTRPLAVLCCLLAWILSTPALAQEYTLDQAHRGRIYLTNGDSLDATFILSLSNDLLKVNQEHTIKALSSRQVERFWFDDGLNRRRRLFLSLPYTTPTGYAIPAFFEVIMDGPAMALLSREQVVTESTPMFDPMTNRTVVATRQRLIQEHFFLGENGIITRYNGRRKDLYAIFADKQDAVEDFVRASRLTTSSREGLVKITDYYNALKSP